MSFTRWLITNKTEKLKILLYILPVLVISYILDRLLSDWVVISIIIGFMTTILITACKYKFYVNLIAKKYNNQLEVNLQQALIQCLGGIVVNGLFAGLFIVIAVAIWLLAVATMAWPIFIIAIVVSIAGVIVFFTMDKLSIFVLLENATDNSLTFKSFIYQFPDLYQTYFKLGLKTTLKAIIYSFIAVLILSIITIIPLNTNINWLLILISLFVSFVVYWIDITAVQYLIREYMR